MLLQICIYRSCKAESISQIKIRTYGFSLCSTLYHNGQAGKSFCMGVVWWKVSHSNPKTRSKANMKHFLMQINYRHQLFLSYCRHPCHKQFIRKVLMKALQCHSKVPSYVTVLHNHTEKPARLASTCIRCSSPLCGYWTAR